MPFYEYECPSCKHTLEVLQKIGEKPLGTCPSCGKRGLKRLMSAPVFRLKGSGWYETDFKSDKENKRNLAGADKEEPKTEAKSDSKADSKADAKPEGAKPEAKPETSADAKTEAKADAKPDAKTEAQPKSKPDSKADSKPPANKRQTTPAKRAAVPARRHK